MGHNNQNDDPGVICLFYDIFDLSILISSATGMYVVYICILEKGRKIISRPGGFLIIFHPPLHRRVENIFPGKIVNKYPCRPLQSGRNPIYLDFLLLKDFEDCDDQKGQNSMRGPYFVSIVC